MMPLRKSSLLLSLALLAATALVVLLSLQLRATRAERSALLDQARFLRAGMYVPPLEAELLGGEPVSLAAAADPTRQLLLVYNTSCPHCEASLPAWQALAERAGADPAVRVYGVSLDPVEATQAYVARHGLRFPSLRLEDPRSIALYRATAVPQTLVIGPGGRVLYARLGRMTTAEAVDSVLVVLGHGGSLQAAAR